MSTFDNGRYTTGGQWTNTGSTNAGQDQANNGQTSSPQQQGESSTSYATRQAAYDYQNQQNQQKN